ncbi:ABC transporter ATP-binding protein [Desulfatibacillum aliphaticivorans]|uniref:ABC transporter ATP-binding protein n=1 Tax=Desulfatibacillum aliphaticivorans TaxID=218208 RepID=UPI000482380D|nr:ATP-binding cassette domain-containing protein [Desulfatibacillum aliphaticivorans]
METDKPVMVRLDKVSFRYPSGDKNSLDAVSASIRKQECVLVAGPTGCGKSTLLKAVSGIIPHASSGIMQGEVWVEGVNSGQSTLPEMAKKAGLVFQSPDDQLFCEYVEDELAFGLENIGVDPRHIPDLVSQALARVGLEGFGSVKIQTLSGGQKQRVAIAAQLAMGAPILALDEPISQLDPAGARDVLGCLQSLREEGLTIILVEHRLSEALRIASRVLIMDKGKLVLDFSPDAIGGYQDQLTKLGLEIPAGVRLGACLNIQSKSIPSVEDIMNSAVFPLLPLNSHHISLVRAEREAAPFIEVKNLCYTYPKTREPVLKDVSFSLEKGEALAVMGRNGSGKSTLLSVLAGLLKPDSGEVLMNGRPLGKKRGRKALLGREIGMVFQNPDLLLIQDSVTEEIAQGLLQKGVPKKQAWREAMEFLRVFGLEKLASMPPWSCSRGQRLQVSLAAALSPGPRVLLLDEPTTGQNKRNIFNMAGLLQKSKTLRSIIFCSHDLSAVCAYAAKLVLLDQGRVIARGPVKEVLGARDLLDRAGVVPHFALELSFATKTAPPLVTAGEWMDRFQSGKEAQN